MESNTVVFFNMFVLLPIIQQWKLSQLLRVAKKFIKPIIMKVVNKNKRNCLYLFDLATARSSMAPVLHTRRSSPSPKRECNQEFSATLNFTNYQTFSWTREHKTSRYTNALKGHCRHSPLLWSALFLMSTWCSFRFL